MRGRQQHHGWLAAGMGCTTSMPSGTTRVWPSSSAAARRGHGNVVTWSSDACSAGGQWSTRQLGTVVVPLKVGWLWRLSCSGGARATRLERAEMARLKRLLSAVARSLICIGSMVAAPRSSSLAQWLICGSGPSAQWLGGGSTLAARWRLLGAAPRCGSTRLHVWMGVRLDEWLHGLHACGSTASGAGPALRTRLDGQCDTMGSTGNAAGWAPWTAPALLAQRAARLHDSVTAFSQLCSARLLGYVDPWQHGFKNGWRKVAASSRRRGSGSGCGFLGSKWCGESSVAR